MSMRYAMFIHVVAFIKRIYETFELNKLRSIDDQSPD